jgi:hypothetical protein
VWQRAMRSARAGDRATAGYAQALGDDVEQTFLVASQIVLEIGVMPSLVYNYQLLADS